MERVSRLVGGGRGSVEDRNLEARLESLIEEVRVLRERVLALEAHLDFPAVRPPGPVVEAEPPAPPQTQVAAPNWGATTVMLSRTALVCFVLVVALALRTATDGRMIDASLGAACGIAYAGGVLCVGAWLARRRPAVGSVLSSCGVLLLCPVVLEASGRLGVLPRSGAYAVVALSGLGLAAIGWLRLVMAPVCLGTPAIILTGLLLGWPHPSIPGLAAVLWAANLAAWAVAGWERCGWVRPVIVIGTGLLGLLWAWSALPATASGAWFAVAAASLGALQVASVVWGPGRRGGFAGVLPSLAVAWAYPATAAVSLTLTAGWAGVLAALVLGGLGAWAHRAGRVPGPSAFLAAGALLLAMALPRTGLSAGTPTLLLAGFALACAVLSCRWEDGGVRLLAYALQAYGVIWGVVSGGFAVVATLPWGSALVAAAAAGVGWGHHHWARSHSPPGQSRFFARWGGTDDLTVVPLLASLITAFLCVRLLVYPMLADSADAFSGAQSVVIHLSAVGLIVGGYLRKDGELRAVGLLVTGIGAVKALIIDLLSIRGVPLVGSVLTFGAAAAVIALVLGRWHGRAKLDTDGSA